MAKKKTDESAQAPAPAKQKPSAASIANLKRAGTKPYPKIEDVIAQITKLLVTKGTYSANLDHAIYIAAVNYLAMLHIQRDIARGSKTYFTIRDQYGNNIPKIKPEYAKLPDITTSAVKALKALGLTIDTLAAADDDPLEKLFDEVNASEED